MQKQIEVDMPKPFEEIFNPYWRYLVYYGGRGSTKSVSVATSLLVLSSLSYEKILCTRQYQNSISDSVKSLLERRLYNLGMSDYFRVTEKYIESRVTGTVFLFKGLENNITSIQSLDDISIAWVEEAQSINNRSLEVLTPTIRNAGSRIIFTFNPYKLDDPVYKMFVEEGRPKSFIRKINYDENPWFKDTPLYDEMVYDREHNYDKYLHKWEGNCITISDAAVFKDKIKVMAFDRPGNIIEYCGIDFGFSVDHFAIITCYIDHEKRLLYINNGARKVKLEIDDTEKFILDNIPHAKKLDIIADSARPEMISYLRKRNFRIRKSIKGPDSKIEGIEFLKNYTIIIHESLKDVISEFSSYSYKVDKHTNVIQSAFIDGNDHYIDATRYALELVRRPAPFMVT